MNIKDKILSNNPERLYSQLPDFPVDYLPGAHHPHCSRYSHHLVWVFGRPLCLGCTSMYSGMVLGLPVTFAIAHLQLPFSYWAIFHCAFLLGPTFIQPWFQYRIFKIIARLMFGIFITSYWISGVILYPAPFNSWLFKIGLIVVFAAIYALLAFLRKTFTNDPCRTCPEGVFPNCDWNFNRYAVSKNQKLTSLRSHRR